MTGSRDMRSLIWKGNATAQWANVPAPVVGGAHEALVRPIAVACCDLDVWTVTGTAPLRASFAVGHEGVGLVVEVGEAVATVQTGDLVIVPFQLSCGQCPTCRRGRTESCDRVAPLAMYGMGPLAGQDGGGFLSDLVHVPFADGMLVPTPPGVAPVAVASCSDNVVDAWRCVGPYVDELNQLSPTDRRILIAGSGSVGLYATAIAAAHDVGVTYVDSDADRRQVAARLGAEVLDDLDAIPTKDRYPVTIATGTDARALRAILRATWPGGVCTDAGIHFEGELTLPMLALYTRGVRLVTGRASARADLPKVLDLIAQGQLRPEAITSEVVPWEAAPQTWPRMRAKTVFVRD
jgi:threonine dehydrogenase-like Zn-dependent dehydrogenase